MRKNESHGFVRLTFWSLSMRVSDEERRQREGFKEKKKCICTLKNTHFPPKVKP